MREGKARKALTSSNNDHWRTPKHIVDAIHKAWGGIALDPCSQSDNPARAKVFAYDADGERFEPKDVADIMRTLKAEDHGLIYINPPYSRMRFWSETAVALADAGWNVLVLCKASTDTAWWQRMEAKAQRLILPRKRIAFEHPDDELRDEARKRPGSTFASAFLYFSPVDGDETAEFASLIDARVIELW